MSCSPNTPSPELTIPLRTPGTSYSNSSQILQAFRAECRTSRITFMQGGHKLKVILRWNQLLLVVDWTSPHTPPCARDSSWVKWRGRSLYFFFFFFATTSSASKFRAAIFFQNPELLFKLWLNCKKIGFQAFHYGIRAHIWVESLFLSVLSRESSCSFWPHRRWFSSWGLWVLLNGLSSLCILD